MKPKISLFKITTAVLVFSIAVFSILQSCQKEIETATPDQVTDQPDLNLKNGSDPILYFGHEVFTRENGKPVTVTMPINNPHFEHFEGMFTLNIQNGDGENDLVSSAIIKVDDEVIFGPEDFNQNVTFLTQEISLTAESVLKVELNGKPGSYLDVWIDGELLPGKALVGPEGGDLYFELTQMVINLIVLENTFNQPEILTVSEINPQFQEELFEGTNFVPLGNLINLESTNSNFQNFITLKINYLQELIENEEDEHELMLFYVNPDEESLTYYDWSELNIEENIYQVALDHFSWFSIGFWRHTWDLETLNYYIAPDESGNLWGGANGPYENLYLAVESVEKWEDYQCSFDFNRQTTPSIFSTNIWVKSESMRDPVDNGVTNGIFALSTIKLLSSLYTVEVVINNSSKCLIYNDSWEKALTHEVGHALGLTHYSVPSHEKCGMPGNPAIKEYPIMGTLYNCYISATREITQCDVDKLLNKYDACEYGQPCPGTPTVTDADGNVYNTVQIGEQCWMAENLNVGTMINGSQDMRDNGVIEKYCYDDDENYCDEYGALYQWDEIMNYKGGEGKQGICPVGWHIPTNTEWDILANFLGDINIVGGKMKERGIEHWNPPNTGATNESGYTALGSGRWLSTSGGYFFPLNSFTVFWSSTEYLYNPKDSWVRVLYNNQSSIKRITSNKENTGNSLRCIKD